MVPARVRILLAIMITVLVVPLLPPLDHSPILSLQTFLILAQELLIGGAAGFSFQVVFQVFVLGAQFMAMKMGLGFASMNDPANGVQTTVLAQFFQILTTMLFVVVGGHLILIEMVVVSFDTLPLGQSSLGPDKAFALANFGGWMFASALIMALPVLTALLVVNIAFGVMSRAAPQLNIFAVGFPFTLICGMALMWIGLATFPVNFDDFMAGGFEFVRDLLEVR